MIIECWVQQKRQNRGMGRACFFWIGSSPSPYFLDQVEPGLQILYLKPMQAKKILFEPTSSLKNTNESRNLLMLMSTWVTKLIFTCIKLHLKCRISVCFMFFTRWVMVRAYEKVRAKNKMSRASSSFQKVEPSQAELLKTPGSRA